MSTPRISVVIPTWCEAVEIADTVCSARAWADEVVVVDADSPDGTAAIAALHGARVVTAASRGRGPQLDAGARVSGGEVVVFLHADARLPPEARPAIHDALRDRDVQGGSFRLQFSPRTMLGDAFGAIDAARRKVGIYYGDSAIFVRREVYEALGGFRPIPIFEDYELVRRLEARGRTRCIEHVEVVVSNRRYVERPLTTIAIWVVLQALYSLGVSPFRLAQWYADIRRADRPSRSRGVTPSPAHGKDPRHG